jgi:hypothetical protein
LARFTLDLEPKKNRKANDASISEETITEMLLLELGTNHPKEVKIVPFNKIEEGNIGADWEWCFYDSYKSQYQPVLVQAKLLDDKDDSYSHVDRFIGKTGVRQIDRLLSTAAKRNVPAIYAFYNHLDDVNRVPKDHCRSFLEPESWGCSIALASAVRATLPLKTFEALKECSRPLPCILCQGFPGRSGPEKVLSTLQGLYDRSVASRTDEFAAAIVEPPSKPSSEPPRYFESLKRLESSEENYLIAKIAAENPGIDGVVLIGEEVAVAETE